MQLRAAAEAHALRVVEACEGPLRVEERTEARCGAQQERHLVRVRVRVRRIRPDPDPDPNPDPNPYQAKLLRLLTAEDEGEGGTFAAVEIVPVLDEQLVYRQPRPSAAAADPLDFNR